MKHTVLTSKWDGLSRHLLATLFPVGPDGQAADGPHVVAPPTDSNIELTANWQSPFEHSGAEVRAPSLMAMLQNGTLQNYVEPFIGTGTDTGLVSRLAQEVKDFSKSAQGRTGMTKMNSTQVFTGAAPIKIPVTLHFRAFRDPVSEVREPIDQLARWTLARQLAANGSIVAAIQAFKNGQGFLKALLPSEAPQMIGFAFNGYTFAPMVIESMSHPITVPRSSAGDPLHVAVQLVLASLTALDANDWTRAGRGQPIQLFNN